MRSISLSVLVVSGLFSLIAESRPLPEKGHSHLMTDTGKLVDPAVPAVRAHHALIYDELHQKVLMTGGSSPLDGGKSFATYNDLWAFDGKKWNLQGNYGDSISSLRLAYNSKEHKIYSFGGYTGSRGSIASFRVFENGAWKNLPTLPDMVLSEPGFVYDINRDRFVAFGGSSGPGKVNSTTWEWDGNSWTKLDLQGPGARQGFAMVYDSKHGKTVLHGGMGNSPSEKFADTWEFDGNKWTKVADSGPTPSLAPGFTYDSKRGIMIVFSGFGEKSGLPPETWGWNGRDWKLLSDSGPARRAMGYMAYDKKRDRIVLFGGRLGWPHDANDTWEWDGKQWQEVKTTGN